jgi:predicted AAA+ superfamily ATPase
MIVLPKEKREPLRLNPGKLLIYGPQKAGKTTFMSQLEDNLILDLEHGSEMISALSVQINSLEDHINI